MDVRLGSTAITSVAGNTLTEQLLDRWDEGLTGWKIQAEERDVGGLQAPS